MRRPTWQGTELCSQFTSEPTYKFTQDLIDDYRLGQHHDSDITKDGNQNLPARSLPNSHLYRHEVGQEVEIVILGCWMLGSFVM